jgi:hypothetical protein
VASEPGWVHNEQGERSAFSSRITVSHDLGDRTLVVVILLAAIIGACGVVMGMNLAKQDMQTQYMMDVSTKLQINTNHTIALESAIKEKDSANSR